MLTIPNPNVTDGDDFSVIPLMQNILAILAGIQSFDGSQIQNGTVLASALAVGLNPLARDSDFFNSFVVSGLMPSGYAGLAFTMPNGIAYVNFNNLLTKYSVAGANYTVATSKDTYYSLKSDGTLDTPSSLANNTAMPTLATGSQFLIRVVSDGTGIVRIDDLRNISPLKNSAPVWIPVTYLNSWVDHTPDPAATSYWGGAQYYKDAFGIVRIRGLVKNGNVALPIFQLPAGYRPDMDIIEPVAINTGIGRITIDRNGNVSGYSSNVDSTWTSLNGLTFKAGR